MLCHHEWDRQTDIQTKHLFLMQLCQHGMMRVVELPLHGVAPVACCRVAPAPGLTIYESTIEASQEIIIMSIYLGKAKNLPSDKYTLSCHTMAQMSSTMLLCAVGVLMIKHSQWQARAGHHVSSQNVCALVSFNFHDAQ